MSLDTKLRLVVDATYTATGLGNDAEYRPDFGKFYVLGDGTTANNADRLRVEEVAFTSGISTVDLLSATAGVLGSESVINELVGICVINAGSDGTANTANVGIVGATGSFSGFFGSADVSIAPIEPGGFFAVINPDADGLGAVTTGAKNIHLQSTTTGGSGNAVVFAIGRSA